MDLENINNNLAALKDTMLLELIVLNATPLSTGMPLTKDVLPAMLDTSGMKKFMNAHAVKHQELLLELTVFAHHQKQSGTNPQRHVTAHQILLEMIVSHAQHQESGTMELTAVNAHHQQLSGTDNNASAQSEDMVHHVLNAHLQDIGISLQTHVFVKNHSSGTDRIVSAHHHSSYIKEDVRDVQMDTHGKITNVKLAHVLLKNYKS